VTSDAYWPDIARNWERVGPPLRPTALDLAAYREAFGDKPEPRAVILGVTPEIYGLPWPAGADVVAVDHTLGMIDAVWPGPPGRAICADWTRIPLEPASRDVALCDGGLHLLSNPHGQVALAESLLQLLAPHGTFVARLFVPGVLPETASAVLDDLFGGLVPNVNVLKLRLAMALQRDASSGVELAAVWSALFGSGTTSDELAARIGWDPVDLATLDSYRDCRTRYYFVTVAEVNDLFCGREGGFELVNVATPSYELGERCPVVTLRRLAA
jgi:SAM-dependent methyltransferase